MGTRTLNDIHNDIKQLITAITSFKENEEGFKVCERFCLSNIRHHRYLSVNSHATKEAVSGIVTKFSIHGKYAVAKKFQELVDSFLNSFDFEKHPQYDLQWYLLTFLLDLSTETHKSSLDSLKTTQDEYNTIIGNEDTVIEEIDWADYLKDGQDDFFHDYKSDSESEWSDDADDNSPELCTVSTPSSATNSNNLVAVVEDKDELSLEVVKRNVERRNWLALNVQNTWWTELPQYKYPVTSRLCDANLCDIWHTKTLRSLTPVTTLSEYQVCRELLWMFHAPSKMVVFQKNKSNFSISSNLSIPSLTATAFASLLSPFCKYFSMLHELEQFDVELYSYDKTNQKPPFTYEAYNAAVRRHLLKCQNEIINIEKKVMQQNGCNTLLSVSTDLKKHLDTIRILHEIHRAVVIDWKDCPNWKCASKLLSTLYFEMQSSHSLEKTNICANLYLSSLAVYLNIIDTWLSEGRLEDWRNEFMIARVPESVVAENNGQCERFVVRILDKICSNDPIMQFLMQKVQHMGHSIELLVCLDRLTDMWKVIIEDHDQRICLSDEFYVKLTSEISKYDSCDSTEETVPVSEVNSSAEEYDEDIERNIIQQLSALNNPFLTKAFEDYIPPELCKKDTAQNCVPEKTVKTYKNELLERLEKVTYVLPFRKILETTLSKILESRYSGASKLVKNIMTQEYKLESHLKLMRSVYMMEAGHVMIKFYQLLFHEIESSQIWDNSYYLSSILEEILSQHWPDFSSHWSITVSNVDTREVLQAADNITLHYTVEWPVNIVLNQKALEKYNEVFRFQLKLKWALWTLNNLRFSDLEGSRSSRITETVEHFQIRRLETLRFWLLHAIGSIHAYLSGQVLQSLGCTLEKALTQADSLDVIMSVHDEYLSKVHEHCLLTVEFEDLMATINNLIEMCVHVRDRWDRRKLMLSAEELSVMENSYIKYHTYLALTLHNAVQHKDADYYKLTPRYRAPNENDASISSIDDLTRNLLTEVAHQSFPPSGIPIPIPRTVFKRSWQAKGYYSEPSLPDDVSLNEYEQTFSYLRWYQCEENFVVLKSSAQSLLREIRNLSS